MYLFTYVTRNEYIFETYNTRVKCHRYAPFFLKNFQVSLFL